MKSNLFVFVLVSLLITSCGSYTEVETSSISFELNFEGPLFEGPNETTVSINFNPSDYGVEKEKIKSVSVKSIVVSTEEEDGFDNFESMLFNFYSNEIGMSNVASISPVAKGNSVITPNVSKETEFKQFSNINEFYLVLDANLTEEYYDDFIIQGEMILTIKVKD
jgi:hypothetical protein